MPVADAGGQHRHAAQRRQVVGIDPPRQPVRHPDEAPLLDCRQHAGVDAISRALAMFGFLYQVMRKWRPARRLTSMILETRAVPPFMKNGYVVGCEETREGVVIDPGDDVDLLLEAVGAARLAVEAHPPDPRAHGPHHRRRPREGGARRSGLAASRRQLSLRGGRAAGAGVRLPRRAAAAGRFRSTRAKDRWRFGALRRVGASHAGPLPRRRLPGGRPGRRQPDANAVRRRHAVRRSIGRTDLPGGDLDTLLRSIREVLFAFPDDTVVLLRARRADDDRRGKADESVPAVTGVSFPSSRVRNSTRRHPACRRSSARRARRVRR